MGPALPASHDPRTWDGGQVPFAGRPDTRWSGQAPPREPRGRSRFRPADCVRTKKITLDIMSPIQGGAATGAAERERIRPLGVIGVHPTHDGLGMAPGARGHTRGARALCDLIESKGPLTGAGMGRAQGDVAHILRGPTPARIINA